MTFLEGPRPGSIVEKMAGNSGLHLNDDGTATISLTVDDVDEVVRWALGFGDEAWISSPSAVVMRAKETLARMRRRYE